MSKAIFDHVRDLAMTLKPEEQVALIGDLAAKLHGKFSPPEQKPFRSLYGALKDFGPSPSKEEIDEARREAWSNFPREDIVKRFAPLRRLTRQSGRSGRILDCPRR